MGYIAVEYILTHPLDFPFQWVSNSATCRRLYEDHIALLQRKGLDLARRRRLDLCACTDYRS